MPEGQRGQGGLGVTATLPPTSSALSPAPPPEGEGFSALPMWGRCPKGREGGPRRGGEGRSNAYWRVVQFPAWMLSMIDFITSNMNFAASGRPSSLPMVAAE